MSKKGGKVVPIIMVLVILVIVLATSTYAWFTTNQEIENTGINIQARASQKMQISVDAKTWKNAITLQDILKASYDVERLNQVPDNFQAYSSIGSLQNGKIEMFHGFVSQDRDTSSESFGKKTLTAEKVVETDGVTGGFLTFDLYLNNDLGSNIYLGRNSYVKYSGEDVASGIENTLRIAFVLEGTLDKNSGSSTLQGMSTTDQSKVVIWEPNSDTHTVAAKENANLEYGIEITDQTVLPYYGIKKEIVRPVLLNSTQEEYFFLMENLISTTSDYGKKDENNKLLFYLPSGVSKIRVYAWVEGQDVDCENEAAGSDFEFNLNFTTKNKES